MNKLYSEDLVFIKHNVLKEDLLLSLCEIKRAAWNYSLTNQKKWIIENSKKSDIHVLLIEDESYIAYLNLKKIKLFNDKGLIVDSFGIGNVSSKFSKKGYGSKLIRGVNEYLIRENKIGVLFCKKELTSFYLRNNYKIEKEDEKNIFL